MLFKGYLAVVQRRHLESAVAEQREELEQQSNEPNGNGGADNWRPNKCAVLSRLIEELQNKTRGRADQMPSEPPPKKAAVTSF